MFVFEVVDRFQLHLTPARGLKRREQEDEEFNQRLHLTPARGLKLEQAFDCLNKAPGAASHTRKGIETAYRCNIESDHFAASHTRKGIETRSQNSFALLLRGCISPPQGD